MTLTSASGPSGDITADTYDVLVVGAGPVGIAAAIELGVRGCKVLVVERDDGVVRYPTAESIDTASMELLRRWGIAEAVLRSGFPPHERRDPPLEYWKSGFFHICVTDPDIEGLAGRIASSGGRQRSKIWQTDPSTNEYRLCYCEDPFGNIIEIYTHNYETLYGGMKTERRETK